MSNIEKIRQEIERLKTTNPSEYNYNNAEGYIWAMNDILAFIDSLPEEKPSEDLEEAAARYERGNRQSILSSVDIVDAFIAGAEWQKEQDAELIEIAYNDGITIGKTKQKEQMMKGAVEGKIGYWNQRGLSIMLDQSLEKLGYGEDTEVKIIIVKNK